MSNPNLPQLEQFSNRLAQVKLETQAFVSVYMAKLGLFQAAAINGDAEAMETLRAELHGTVDSILDSTAMDGLLNRQVVTGLHDLSHLRGHF